MNSNNKIILLLLILILLAGAFNVLAEDSMVIGEQSLLSDDTPQTENSASEPGIISEETEEAVPEIEAEKTEEAEQGIAPEEAEESEPSAESADNSHEELVLEQAIAPELSQEETAAGVGGEAESHQAPAVGIMAAPAVIDTENIVVYNFDELKAALSGSNNYTNIYLGADIDMKALGIEIHSSKKRVVISGINPLNGSGPFTINEYNSLDPAYTIRVVSNSGAKEVIMRDVNVTGRNYYGAVCIYDGVSGVRVTFENVDYNGPQISYNRGGTVCITGSSNIRIAGGNGLSDAQELAEVSGLELGGNTRIEHYAPILSGLWLVGSGSYIKVLSGADVVWNETGSYMIFQDNLEPADLTLEPGASFTINTANGLFYNTSTTFHQFGDVLLDLGAKLEIRQQGAASLPIMKVNRGIRALEGASLIILAQSAPQLLFMTGNADISITSPDTLVLYNGANKLIEWSDSNAHSISILSSFINYWGSPCDLGALGSLEDSPDIRWRRKNGVDLSVEINASSSATVSVTSDYTENDYGAPPNAQSLNIQAARIITAGKMALLLDTVTDTSIYISGQTEPHAQLRAVYTDAQGVERTAYGSADSGGSFDITLEGGNAPALGSTVLVYSSAGYKNVIETTVTVATPTNALSFMHVPSGLVFPETDITGKRELIERADSGWHIIIADTRAPGSKWELYARLKEPPAGGSEYSLPQFEGSVVLKNKDGTLTALTDSIERAATGEALGEAETIIGWPADEGIMLFLDTALVYSGVAYSAKVEWILADVP